MGRVTFEMNDRFEQKTIIDRVDDANNIGRYECLKAVAGIIKMLDAGGPVAGTTAKETMLRYLREPAR